MLTKPAETLMYVMVRPVIITLIIWIVSTDSGFANIVAPDIEPLNETITTFRKDLEAENYQDALASANLIIRLLENGDETDLSGYVTALMNLAVIQKRLGSMADSEHNFLKVIGLIEQSDGGYSTRLINILGHLAGIYYQTGRHTEALETLRRAQHIIHRTDGVFALDQLKIVDWITTTNLKLGRNSAADVQQRFYYTVNLKNYGESSPMMAPAMTRLGDWFRQSRQYANALNMYRQHLDLLIGDENVTDLELVEPLRRISSTLLLQGACCPDRPLERTLDIVLNDPNTDDADKLQALLHLADMTLLQKNTSRAMELYQQAWSMKKPAGNINEQDQEPFSLPTQLGIGRTDDVVFAYQRALRGSVIHRRHFMDPFNSTESTAISVTSDSASKSLPGKRELIGAPLSLCYPQLLDLVKGANSESILDYYMDLDYSVDSTGKVTELNVVDSNTPPRLEKYIKNMLIATRFRPRLEDGKPVFTEHLKMHQTLALNSDSNQYQREALPYSKSAVLEGCYKLAALSS